MVKICVVIILIVSFLFSGCNRQPCFNPIGKYVNTNYDYSPFIVDIPYSIDTLFLNQDYTFNSGYWGDGAWSIFEEDNICYIRLRYKYELGNASYVGPLVEGNEGVKIILNSDMNHHYKKINE
jgi:hypothetical protein